MGREVPHAGGGEAPHRGGEKPTQGGGEAPHGGGDNPHRVVEKATRRWRTNPHRGGRDITTEPVYLFSFFFFKESQHKRPNFVAHNLSL